MKHILHLMTKLPDKYNSKYVEFTDTELTNYHHTFVCLVSSAELGESTKGIDSVNVIDLNSKGKIEKWIEVFKLMTSQRYDLNILHGLFYTGPFLAFLAVIFKLFAIGEKTLWMTWGGDIYYFQNRAKNMLGWLNEQFRKSIIKRFYFISSPIKGEVELIKLNYKSNAINFSAFYPNPMPYQEVERTLPLGMSDNKVHLMIGNSADPQNNHLTMLEKIAPLKGLVKISCVLSYANVDNSYTEEVVRKGYEIFADDFFPLRDFMNPTDYSQLLLDVDVAIYYHNRQQAMGNIYQFLYLGKSVFVRSDTLSNQHLKSIGFKINDSEDLATITIEELKAINKESKANQVTNQAIIDKYCSDDAAEKVWKNSLRQAFTLLKKSD